MQASMASIYKRPETSYIWITYKGADGCRKRINTGYRWDNPGDRKQAEKLAKMKTLEELVSKPIKSTGGWEDWVLPWINGRWGHSKNSTPDKYRNYFLRWLDFFEDTDVANPAALRREHVLAYLEWRKKRGGERNTAIHEIKFLGIVMDEAITRGYASQNPCRKLGLKKDEVKHKVPWTPQQVSFALESVEEIEPFGWLHVALLMGRYQAVRIGQCCVPLSGIDLDRRIINFPRDIVKGGKGYSQPIDPEFYPILADIVKHRRKLSKAALCDFPPMHRLCVSIFIDALTHYDEGFEQLSHHGLRATWITQAALAGVPETLAKRFVNHASSEVHAIYQCITADDLMPMLDALALARNKQAALLLPSHR
jgi:hypothetical protein